MRLYLSMNTILGLLAVINPTTSAQVTFTDVAEAVGLGGLGAVKAYWATWGDYDNDGDADLVLLREALLGIRLYRERKVTCGKNQTV